MKRLWVALGIAALLAAGAAVQQLQKDEEYRDLLATGEQRLSQQADVAAIEAFSGALALRPGSMVSHLRRAAAYRSRGQRDEAVRDLQAAMQLAPDATAPIIAMGDLYEAAGEYARAADYYSEAALLLKDQDPPLLYRLGLAQYRAGRSAAAIDPLQRAVARNDSMAEAHYVLGLAYRDVQRLDDAAAALERAVRVAPGLIPAREELADVYRVQHKPAEEMIQLQALSALDGRPDRTAAIALALVRSGQFDGAVGAVADVASAAPDNVTLQLTLARAYLGSAARTRDREALKHATDALALVLAGSARRSEALALLGHAHQIAGDGPGAERLLRQAVATSPVDPEAFGFLADTAEALGHDVIARDALINLDALQGDTAPAQQRAARAGRLGAISMRVNDAPAAAVYFGHAVENGFGDAGTWGLLARARWQSGDAVGAHAALQHGLQLDPRNQELTLLARTISR